MKKLRKGQRLELIRIAEYMVSGGAYFWSGYLAFALFYGFQTDSVSFEGLGWSLFWAKLAANLIGWTVNFVLQRYWVFKNPHLKGHLGDVTARYIALTLFDFVLDFFIVYGLAQIGISPYIGQFVSAGFFTVWNYFWYKYWVFPHRYHPKHAKKVKARR